jgi:hypothetical protein
MSVREAVVGALGTELGRRWNLGALGAEIHYWNPGLCRVSGALPSVFCRTLDKDFFAESRTR